MNLRGRKNKQNKKKNIIAIAKPCPARIQRTLSGFVIKLRAVGRSRKRKGDGTILARHTCQSRRMPLRAVRPGNHRLSHTYRVPIVPSIAATHEIAFIAHSYIHTNTHIFAHTPRVPVRCTIQTAGVRAEKARERRSVLSLDRYVSCDKDVAR